jgi:hypothetical protein
MCCKPNLGYFVSPPIFNVGEGKGIHLDKHCPFYPMISADVSTEDITKIQTEIN